MGFNPSRPNQDLWWRKSNDYEGYDYVATHVDDIIIVSKNPTQYMIKLEQEFNIRNIEDSPSYYLGNNIKRILNISTLPQLNISKKRSENMKRNMGRLRNTQHPWDRFIQKMKNLHF